MGADLRLYREEEIQVHKDIMAQVLLKLIRLLGYKLMVKWISKPNQQQYCDWFLKKES